MENILIHHWDTDGICSASLLLDRIEIHDNITPHIGNYYLTDDEIKIIKEYDKVFVVDMALPEENIIELSKSSEITIFDHHIQKKFNFVNHVNPIADGKKSENYPSCTWVIKEYFNIETNLLVILGVIGDNEHKIRENEVFYEVVKSFCERNSTTLDNLIKAVHLIDSNYKLGKKTEVEKIPHYIGEMSLEDILDHDEWNGNVDVIEREIERAIGSRSSVGKNIDIVDIEIPYNIISEITRRIAWNTGKNAVVVNRGYFPDKSQIYVRSSTTDLSPLISKIKSMGFNSGGKVNVLGAIVPKNLTDMIVEKIIKFLEGEDTW